MLTSFIVENWYVGIPLVLGLMLLDALLTQVGYKVYLRYGKQYVEYEHLELNPYWQEDVEKKGRMLSLRYLGLFAFKAAVLVGTYAVLPRLFVEVLVGLQCGTFLPIVLIHVNNLIYYPISSRIPGGMEGRIRYSYRLSAISHTFANMRTGLLLAVLLLFTQPSVFAVAFAAAQFLGVLTGLSWARRAKDKEAPEQKDAPEERKKRRWNIFTLLRIVIAVAAAVVLIVFAVGLLRNEYDKDYREALSAYDSGDYAKAMTGFLKLHNLRPEEPGAHFNLGLCYYNLGWFEKAEGCFRKFLELHGTGERTEDARQMIEQCQQAIEDSDE